MPLNQEKRLDTRDRILWENATSCHPFHHREFLLQRFRSFKGEPPAVAGFLLYPDSPAKMKTTSQEAFCFKPIPQHDRGKGHQTVHNTHQHHTMLSRQDKRNGSRGRKTEEQKDNQTETSLVSDKPNQGMTEMQSQYQKDFPPPSSCCRRRTPALPQPDNIGINPAFRIDFSTVQRETFPC